MQQRQLIVLKFGGSVLADESALEVAVREIQRWRREGWNVVAVVSAFAGATSALEADARASSPRPDPHALAALLHVGEQHSAARLTLALDRRGLSACTLGSAQLGLTAEGDPLDATPVDLDPFPLAAAFDRDEVVVVPGFQASDVEGRAVTLGRGGSDLTALFLAQRLGAQRCRLIKDVDGLYERDPSVPGPRPRRYELAHWDDALATDGSIVQHGALRFARASGLAFELGRAGCDSATAIGEHRARFARPSVPPKPLRVALLGLGAVGSQLWSDLARDPERYQVVSVVVRDPHKQRKVQVPPELLSTGPIEAAASGVDVVVELLGGLHVPALAIEAALRSGAHVVSANKRVVAELGPRLHALARAHACRFLHSAAVGGALPAIEALSRARTQGLEPRALRGVLNGTCNFVLERLARGSTLQAATDAARAAGLAEADCTRDLDGSDAFDKLRVLAQTLDLDPRPHAPHQAPSTGAPPPFEPLDPASLEAAQGATPSGHVLRQVASLDATNASLRVELLELPVGDPLASIADEGNALCIEFEGGDRQLLLGRGAGPAPTAGSLLGDLDQLQREIHARRARPTTRPAPQPSHPQPLRA